MAMKDKKIVSCVKDKLTALYDLVDSMVKKDSAILTVLVGSDVSASEQQQIDDDLHNKYGDSFDIDIKRGEQPVYSFLVGME
jgi:dihydroxyacetone kinase-like predicted kinase